MTRKTKTYLMIYLSSDDLYFTFRNLYWNDDFIKKAKIHEDDWNKRLDSLADEIQAAYDVRSNQQEREKRAQG